MFRNILVGCDDSDGAFDALALAQQLRDPEDGRLILACVYPFFRAFSAPAMPFAYGDWLRDRAEQTLDRVAERVSAGIRVERETISDSSAAAGLNVLAESMGADLIVLGASHRGLPGKMTARTTVQRLLHGAPCAVAVAAPGQEHRFAERHRICVAYDASPQARHALDTAYAIAASTGAHMVICDVLEPIAYQSGFAITVPDVQLDEHRQAWVREELKEAAARAPEGVSVETHFALGVPAHAILEQAGPDADLIVAGSRGYGALHRAIAGSVSGALMTSGDAPVLVTRRVPADTVAENAAPAAASSRS